MALARLYYVHTCMNGTCDSSSYKSTRDREFILWVTATLRKSESVSTFRKYARSRVFELTCSMTEGLSKKEAARRQFPEGLVK